MNRFAAAGVVGLAVAAAAAGQADAQISKSGVTKVAPALSPSVAPSIAPPPGVAPIPQKPIDDGRLAQGSSPAPPPPYVWFKFDGDTKDATGRLKPLTENYDWVKDTFGPGRSGLAKTWEQWPYSSSLPYLERDVGTFFVRDAFSVAIVARGVAWGAQKAGARNQGQICGLNTLFSIRGLSVSVYGCGTFATTGFLKVHMMGRDGDNAKIGGEPYVDQGVAITAGHWNDIFVSYDPNARKVSAWLNGVFLGAAPVSPLPTGTSTLRVGPMTEGSLDEIKYWPQTLTPSSFQSTVPVAAPR